MSAAQAEGLPPDPLPSREAIARQFLAEETSLVADLMARATPRAEEASAIARSAERLVALARANRGGHGGVDAFLHEYGLTSEEGVILMCLAEALLRIPDAGTADALIAEKIGEGRWERHLGASDSAFVNASTFGLMLTGRVVRLGEDTSAGPAGVLKRLIARSGEPVIRSALRQAMRILGDSFVFGRTIAEALRRARAYVAQGYRLSYDMLGERARSERDARRYFERYASAIAAIGAALAPDDAEGDLAHRPSVSVKLSALHARFDPGKEAQLERELLPRLLALATAARRQGIALTIDAEEQDRLDVTLQLFARALIDPALAGWSGLGLAVQAYGKRALPVLLWLQQLARAHAKRIPVRLVKGAYWDSEIKWAQERGLADYPVFTHKAYTDVSYLACMRVLLGDAQAFAPQFATHNAHTMASVCVAGGAQRYELQRLHGMGEALYQEGVAAGLLHAPCRIYAPVGAHADLVAYLVRRLLENGANSSFVHRLADPGARLEEIVGDPLATARRIGAAEPLPRPWQIFLPERRNSEGLALSEPSVRAPVRAAIEAALAHPITAAPIVAGSVLAAEGPLAEVLSPHDRRHRVGWFRSADGPICAAALSSAAAALPAWERRGGPARARSCKRLLSPVGPLSATGPLNRRRASLA